MRPQHRKRFGIDALGYLATVMACSSTGCISNSWWNAFLDPTQPLSRENSVNEIQDAISFRDKPMGIPGAVAPTAEDLVATVEPYRFGPGDQLSIRMLDFLQPGTESEFTPTSVDDVGYVHIPQLDPVYVEGLTQQETQEEIIRQAQAKGIYRADRSPTVVVNALTQQQRLYNIDGAVVNPGPYRIQRSDFRLREAINQAGSLDPTVRTIYVLRNEPREKRVVNPPVSSAPPAAPVTPPVEGSALPPVSPFGGSEAAPGPASPAIGPEPAKPSGRTLAAADNNTFLPADAVEQDLLEAMGENGAPSGAPKAATGSTGAQNHSPESLPSFTFEEGSGSWVPDASGAPAAPGTAPVHALPPGEAVDWSDLASDGSQRIIRISAEALRNGDPAANIVIRHQDWIKVDPGPVGVVVLGGHVLRPGSYALNGQEWTLTQMIYAAGGFDQLAWPTRCEIRRRIDSGREEITQWDLARIMDGKDPDLFLKPQDTVVVGTHAIAPLLATIRNSFRFTYGFGFVYDRNFADIDSYFGDVNPAARRRQEQQQLFGNLFGF